MWERGARHNPVSLRYRFYADHRPFLPQDPTLGFLRTAEGSYESIHLIFRVTKDKLKYIYSNNIPVKDREDLKNLMYYDNIFKNNFKYLSLVASIFITAGVCNTVHFGRNHFYKFLTFGLANCVAYSAINYFYQLSYNDLVSYYYFKYQNIAMDNISETKDKRREFYQLDTSTYYRESSQDIRHNAHHPANSGHHDHDTSTYYGPYPVRLFKCFIFFNF